MTITLTPQRAQDPSTRARAAQVGLLFLIATAAFIGADTLVGGALAGPDPLARAADHTTELATGALLLFGQFGVVGIAVLLYPVLRRHGESLALAHVGFRVAELAASLFYLAVPLMMIALAGTPSSAGLGALLQAQHGVSVLMIYMVTAAGGMCMAVLLYRSGLVPRWIAVLGLVGYPALLAGCILDVYGIADMTQGPGLVALVPGGIFELVLPIWLITRGFRAPSR